MPIEVHVVDTVPTTEYQGTVYDQRVVVELPDSTEMGLFDPNMEVTEDMVCQHRLINLSLLISGEDIAVVGDENLGVRPQSDSSISWNNHVYTTRVEGISFEGATAEVNLDVGIGDLTLNIRSDLAGNMSSGDTIRIEAQRSDVKNVVEGI